MEDGPVWEIDEDLIGEVGKILAGDSSSTRLPRHRHDLGHSQVEIMQRARIIVATAQEVVERGYAAATTRDITTRAGVSSKTFYSFYGDKESAFWAAFTLMDGVIVQQLRELDLTEVSLSTLRGAVDGFLGFLQLVPLMSEVHVVQGRAAGARVSARQRAIADEFVTTVLSLAERARDQDDRVMVPSRPVVVAVLGGINELVHRHLSERRIDTVTDLEPAVTELLARVFLPHLWPERDVSP